jgi:hypothetical protein
VEEPEAVCATQLLPTKVANWAGALLHATSCQGALFASSRVDPQTPHMLVSPPACPHAPP